MLREVWLNTEMEKIDTHKDIMVKVLLDNGVIGMFIDRKTTAKYSFRLQKLERPIAVRNIDRMNNSRGAITHQVKVNVYYKNHIKRIRMDMYDLGKTEVILEMLWLQAYNPEINQETGEVKMMRCLPLCGRAGQNKEKKERKVKREKRVVTLEEEKIVRQAIDDKEDWGKEEEIEEDHRKIKEIVLKRFWKWRKVFGKIESERMSMRKIWDHAIDIKKTFKP